MPWFHFAQAVVKRMKQVGLTDAYKNEGRTRTPALWCHDFHSRVFHSREFSVPKATSDCIGLSWWRFGV